MDDERDKATALDLGANDYVTKPFEMAQLVTRIQLALRAGQFQDPRQSCTIQAGAVEIDLAAGRVTRGGLPVALTPTEYRLLEVLATNAGRLCTHRFLLERVREAGHDQDSQYLVRHMASLRRKLDDPSAPQLLVTDPGMGYRFLGPR